MQTVENKHDDKVPPVGTPLFGQPLSYWTQVLSFNMGNVLAHVWQAGEWGEHHHDLDKALEFLELEQSNRWASVLPLPSGHRAQLDNYAAAHKGRTVRELICWHILRRTSTPQDKESYEQIVGLIGMLRDILDA